MLTKRVVCLLLALVLVLALAACGKTQSDPKPGEGTQPAGQSQTQAPGQETDKPAEPGGSIAKVLLPGTLLQFNQKEGEAPVLRGIRLAGNRVGSSEFNAGEPAAEGFRCVFELNEWVECYPDTDAAEGLTCWVLKRRADPAAYESERFSEETEGFVLSQALEKSPDGDEYPWGSFYLNPDDWEPGDYDLIFTLDGKAVAGTQLRFYGDGELQEKSDDELTALMTSLVTK